MSNDQSPPPRKITPYKKGGRRQSPFADIAFQFTGTALDVAIQQSRQEAEEPPQPENELSNDANAPAEASPLPVNTIQEVEKNPPASEIDVRDNQEIAAGLIPAKPNKDTVLREVRLGRSKASSRNSAPTGRKNSQPSAFNPSFQAFVDRWKHGLRRGQLRMCEVLFNKTHAIGLTECETSFSVLMHESGLSRRQAFQIMSELEKMGFVERLEIARHSTRKGTGSHIRFHLTPKS